MEATEARDASDALIPAHAEGAIGQPAAAGTFIDIAAAASGAARRTNPFVVQCTTNVRQNGGSGGRQDWERQDVAQRTTNVVRQGRAGGLPDGRLRYMEVTEAQTEGVDVWPWIEP